MLGNLGTALQSSNGPSGNGRQPQGIAAAEPIERKVARLTPGQLDCLRLVDQHLNSKEIAAELHISSHTVDQRVRQALAILGVERRAQAARIVAQYAGPYEGGYQRLIHQPPYIEPQASPSHP